MKIQGKCGMRSNTTWHFIQKSNNISSLNVLHICTVYIGTTEPHIREIASDSLMSPSTEHWKHSAQVDTFQICV